MYSQFKTGCFQSKQSNKNKTCPPKGYSMSIWITHTRRIRNKSKGYMRFIFYQKLFTIFLFMKIYQSFWCFPRFMGRQMDWWSAEKFSINFFKISIKLFTKLQTRQHRLKRKYFWENVSKARSLVSNNSFFCFLEKLQFY